LGVVALTAIPHPISTGAAAETLNVAAEEESEKQPVSTLAGVQETRQSFGVDVEVAEEVKASGVGGGG
jgi:hypothetical protein